MKRQVRLFPFLLLLFSSNVFADLPCAYLNDQGNVEQVASVSKAPKRYQSRVVCADSTGQGIKGAEISNPEDVELTGTVRAASFVTDLGPIDVRWPLSVERCLGKSPARAVADAAATVNRAVASARFPSDIKNGSRQWTMVFTDKATATREFPAAITLGGHPGFMLPPNKIYIIADFISPDCAGGAVSDAILTQVLLHEMGHVIEFLMLGNQFGVDRERAEGFASWFEQYSSDYSRVIDHGTVKAYYHRLAVEALKAMPGPFEGTPYDYARAALRFDAIVNKRGISGLMDVYQAMKSSNLSFKEAVQNKLHWSDQVMDKEMEGVVKE